ncbi:hypothetical protein FPOAC2_03850 [Fusarium poae]
MKESGSAHKIISVLLRLSEFASAVIVLGLLSRFCYYIGIAQASVDGRIIYAIVVACLGIIYSIFFCPPFRNMFLGFPFDFLLFVMWLIAYCLLQTVLCSLVLFEEDFLLIIYIVRHVQKTGGSTCSARWYYNYWGYYWGRFYRVGPIGTVSIDGAGCSQWRTVLAFSFIAWFLHLLSGILGVYVFRTYIKLDETKRDIKHHAEKLTK